MIQPTILVCCSYKIVPNWKGKQNKQGVCLAIYIKKYLKAKEELWKLKYLTMQKKKSSKNPLKETKILQDIIFL
jgi:hypothetical protein